jgi:hypothetical protein
VTAPRLAEAVLRVVFLPDGRLELHGRLLMECVGKTITLDCAPDEVMDLYETTAAAIAEAARKERGEPEPEPAPQFEEEPEPELSFTPGFSLSAFEGAGQPANLEAPAPAPVVPLRPRPVQRVVTDEAGNPVLPRSGVDAASVVVATDPGENGVDLL